MDVIINDLFFTNTIISNNIKSRKIISIIENNECEYELVTNSYISIIEKISDKILLNVEIFINLFLIYEREESRLSFVNKDLSYKNLKKILIKLYKEIDSISILEELLNEFYKIIHLNLKLYDKVLKYDIITSISRFFEYLENNTILFLIKESEKEIICNICTEKKQYIKLLCCKQTVCKDCWSKGDFKSCPYCKLDFTQKININMNKIKNLYYKNE